MRINFFSYFDLYYMLLNFSTFQLRREEHKSRQNYNFSLIKNFRNLIIEMELTPHDQQESCLQNWRRFLTYFENSEG